MIKAILLVTLLLINFTAALADQGEQTITLKDGSQIKGVLSGIQDGVYVVKTPIIGDVHVAASDVASITNGDALPATNAPASAFSMPNTGSAAAPNMDAQIASAQQRLLSNPQSMAILQQMAQDPQIMQALQDPALVEAVTNHDYQAVQNNPGIQKLMQDPNMQALLQKLASQQQQQNTSSTQ